MNRGLKRAVLSLLAISAIQPALAQTPEKDSFERVSVGNRGVQGNSNSEFPVITPDGRYVAFASWATNFAGPDGNRYSDVFVRDRKAGTTERISVNSSGEQVHYGGELPSISANGRWVAFESYGDNVVPGDTNGAVDIFLRDRVAGTTTRISVSSAEVEANDSSYFPKISADGRFVAFYSSASNLVPHDDLHSLDIFVRDLRRGVTERINGVPATEYTSERGLSISADGRFVAFDAADAVYLVDRQTDTSEIVSIGNDRSPANGGSYHPAVSSDGRFVAFESVASNLVADDLNESSDVFVRDRARRITERLSIGAAGLEGNGYSTYPSISDTGRFVAFNSWASNLVADDTDQTNDMFVHDRLTHATERVSGGTDYVDHGYEQQPASVTRDGRHIAVVTDGALVPEDTNGTGDVFLRDRKRVRNDLLVDFGRFGLLEGISGGDPQLPWGLTWTSIDTASPTAIAVGDLDGSFVDEAIATFPGRGLSARYNNAGPWRRLLGEMPRYFIAADLDGNSSDEIVVDLGAKGLFARYNNAGGFVKLHDSASEGLASGDLDGDGKVDLIADYGSAGLLAFFDNKRWGRLHPKSPMYFTVGDLDRDHKDDLIADFGPGGILALFNNTLPWKRLRAGVSEGLATGDLDGDGRDEILVDLGQRGLSVRYATGNAWQQFDTRSPLRFLTADLLHFDSEQVIASFPGEGVQARTGTLNQWDTLKRSPEEGMAIGAFH